MEERLVMLNVVGTNVLGMQLPETSNVVCERIDQKQKLLLMRLNNIEKPPTPSRYTTTTYPKVKVVS